MAFEMAGETGPVETIVGNGIQTAAVLTIAVPVYRDNPGTMIDALSKCPGAENTAILVYDDGGADPELTAHLEKAIGAWPGPGKLISAAENRGRAFARNRLLAHAPTDWVLLLDADMLPDNAEFLQAYHRARASVDGPALIAGGYSLRQVNPTHSQKLHAAQALKSECLDASTRAREPGRYVFTSNILVHRHILETIPFDDEFSGWGWEDVDWGLRVAAAYPIRHIDNTATHLGLDDTDVLLNKYGTSGANFARLVARHPLATENMALTVASRRLAAWPGRSLIRRLARILAGAHLPISLRLAALKVYRAAAYAEHLR